ncbi:MAG: PP2C family protein-serine/threonine phosphatase [Candidatus Eisenbacteria bacterium]|nr:PP2C family protein-serine/threonine phosphatase [Candidatus Eisenbacteria bacterium]
MLWGSAPALLAQLVTGWAAAAGGPWYQALPYVTKLYILNGTSLLLLLIPVSVAYAFGKYRLLEVESRLKRGTRLVLVTGGAVLVLLLVCALIYLGSSRLLPLLGIGGDVPPIAIAMVLAFGFLPAQRSLRRSLENRIYPERLRLQATLHEFLLQSHVSRAFWTELARRLRDSIGASAVFPLLRRRDALVYAVECCELAPFKAGDQFGQALLNARHPLLVDEMVASGRIPLTDPQKAWLAERAAALIVPLETVSGLRGFLVVGERLSGDDYTPEELEILRALSPQIALVAETIELLEERTERQRLDDEIRMARGIQEGLMPRELPPTPGLESAARIRFCGDVAGDYYDVIALADGRTLLAVGDVTGKGLGAALIMSNLQAALRAMNGVGLSLAEVVARINTLIHDNTPDDLFITLFVALYDPATATLSYVNAGHDPPLVCAYDGNVTRLPATGLLVGVFPGAMYDQRVLHLNPGDLVLFYTDGATEAMNDEEEELGDDRLARMVADNRSAPVAALLTAIEDGVKAFHGGRPLHDDMTLVAIRRLSAGESGAVS